MRDLLDAYAPQPGDQEALCTVTDDPSFGDPAGVATCAGAAVDGRVEVTAVGLVGSSAFTCRVRRDDGARDDLEAAALDACRDSLERLATDAEETSAP